MCIYVVGKVRYYNDLIFYQPFKQSNIYYINETY